MITPNRRCRNVNAIFRLQMNLYRRMPLYVDTIRNNVHVPNHPDTQAYCWNHCRMITGFRVREGDIGGMRGLIYDPPPNSPLPAVIPTGRYVAGMRRIYITAAEGTRRYGENESGPYMNMIPQPGAAPDRFTDAIADRDLGDYCNDIRDVGARLADASLDLQDPGSWEATPTEMASLNAQIWDVGSNGSRWLILRTRAPVPAGTELRADYGVGYWSGSFFHTEYDINEDGIVDNYDNLPTVVVSEAYKNA